MIIARVRGICVRGEYLSRVYLSRVAGRWEFPSIGRYSLKTGGVVTALFAIAAAAHPGTVACLEDGGGKSCSPVAPSPEWVEATNTAVCGRYLRHFLAAIATQEGADPIGTLAAGETLTRSCGVAALELIRFADFASDAAFVQTADYVEDTTHPLSGMATLLHQRFIDAAIAAGGVPPAWASACRGVLSLTYSFCLLSSDDARGIVAELQQRGVKRLLDPLAGTGLHARLLCDAGGLGFDVRASDIQPMTLGGHSWYLVEKLAVEDVDWAACAGDDSALLLSWPPRWSPAGEIALERFQGRFVIFVGDRGQWTGSTPFQTALQGHLWMEVWRREILRWPRMEDDIRIYERMRQVYA